MNLVSEYIKSIMNSLKILLIDEVDYDKDRTSIAEVAGILISLDKTTPKRVTMSRGLLLRLS